MGSDNLKGQMLGQYELRELLGVGGMGSVYRGFQTALKREVAVKVLPSTLAQQPGYIERFTREAETSAALEHPHIVPIVDYGTQRGISYVVMRLLTGGTLAERINQAQADNRGLPSLGETAKLLRELASALDYAHNRGVIHRDIKTSNVMFDNQGNSYLVDFGIAKLMNATNKLTGTGMAVGTPTYMAPEQWSGDEVFPATDQYSLGVLAYIAVTGREPFEATTPFQLLNKHLHEMPTPLTILRTDLPPALDLVLARALAKDPKARFQSCTAFAQAFESAIEGQKGGETNFFVFKVPPKQQANFAPAPQPYATPPQYMSTGAGGMYPPPPTQKRNSGLVFGMAAVILLLIGAVIVLLLSNNNTGDNDDIIALSPTGTNDSSVVILRTDEPIITPVDITETAVVIEMTRIAEIIFATQTAQTMGDNVTSSTPISAEVTETPEIIPTDIPVRVTNTPLPSYTPQPPTETPFLITNTPLPSYTPVPPTETAIRVTNTPLPSYTPMPPTETPASTTVMLQIDRFGAWVRSQPDSSASRLGSIIDDSVEVVSMSADGEWYGVPYQGEIGWIQNTSSVTLLGDVSLVPVVVAESQSMTVTIDRLGAWVREAPDAESTRLGAIINETIPVIGISADGDWYQIEFEGNLAWIVKNSSIQLNGNESLLPVVGGNLTVTIDRLGAWVRSAPQSDSTRLGSLIDATVDVIGISPDGDWYAITYQGETGWIVKNVSVTLNGDESELVVITP
ncbi:MAG: protein kinase [bacterium]|nr:protein kinase [bacterium]